MRELNEQELNAVKYLEEYAAEVLSIAKSFLGIKTDIEQAAELLRAANAIKGMA